MPKFNSAYKEADGTQLAWVSAHHVCHLSRAPLLHWEMLESPFYVRQHGLTEDVQ